MLSRHRITYFIFVPVLFQGAPNMMAAQSGMAQAVHAGGYDSDVENAASAQNNAAAMGSSFGDKAIRRAFIKKVYGILSIQLLVTIGIIALFIYPPKIREYVMRNQWVYLTSFGVMMVSLYFADEHVVFLRLIPPTLDVSALCTKIDCLTCEVIIVNFISDLHDLIGMLRGS